MILNRYNIKNNTNFFLERNYKLPEYNIETVIKNTRENPTWLHFGSSNIFRSHIAVIAQKLLNQGKIDTGIIDCITTDKEVIDRIYKPFDNLTIAVTLKSNGSIDKEIVGSIADVIPPDFDYLKRVVENKSLQIISYTVTEKGYYIKDNNGNYLPAVIDFINTFNKSQDMVCVKCYMDVKHFANPSNLICISVYLAYLRYKAGKLPLAFLSLDNLSHNGEHLYNKMFTIARECVNKGFADTGFLDYLSDEKLVSFPWSMIDKITPRPDSMVAKMLEDDGLCNIELYEGTNNTFRSVFVNAEETEYLAIEDNFPNGRPSLESAGVLFAPRETIDKIEKMKVGTCLNPLHTALAIFGCLLGYKKISDEMKDKSLVEFIKKLGFNECLPVCISPEILEPRDFINEVINIRLPNTFIPDTPQRIASDTSLKMPIRFGESLKAYYNKKDGSIDNLYYMPLVFAGYLRYLIAYDDNGNSFTLSYDPRLEELVNKMSGVNIGSTSLPDSVKSIIKDSTIFGIDLYTTTLGEKVERYLLDMLASKGSVRKVLDDVLSRPCVY